MRWLLVWICLVPLGVAAVPTQIEVRVLAKDAKFIGSGMGGMAVTIADHGSNEVLAQGMISGGTGDTSRIMRKSWKRQQPLSTEDAASYRATLDIDTPLLVRVSAEGPLDFPHARQLISVTHWLVPGKHVTGGDALRLELPGFVVTTRAEPADLDLAGGTATVTIGAEVTMMCGCPLTPGGLWNSDAYEINAWLYRDGQRVAALPLAYAGEANQFTTSWRPETPGYYEIVTYAYDPANGNTGVDRTGVRVRP